MCIKYELDANNNENISFSKIMQLASGGYSKRFPFLLNTNFDFPKQYRNMSEKELATEIFSLIVLGGATADDVSKVIYLSKQQVMNKFRAHIKNISLYRNTVK